MLVTFFQIHGLRRRAAALLLAAGGGALLASDAAAGTGVLHLHCTNAYGGANWSIAVDLDHGLVDSRPATVSESWIKWSDTHGGVYELERASGKLQLRGASSTGGYFLHYTCTPE